MLDPLAAMRPDATLVHAPNANVYATRTIRKGDVERALHAIASAIQWTRSARRWSSMCRSNRTPPSRDWDANGRLTIWSTLGRITLGRADIARMLRLPMSRVRVIGTTVGGNFGGKNEITQEPVLALLSKKTGRPVKGLFTRVEEFTSTTTARHPLIMDYKTGRDERGPILARKIRLVLDGGAYCSWSETTLGKACILSAGPYDISRTCLRKRLSSTRTRR